MDSENVKIREARENEWQKIPWLHRDEGEEYMEEALERNRIRFEKMKRGKRVVLLAELQGAVVGAVQLQFFHKEEDIANGKTLAHIDDLVVDPDFRNKGIGKKLMTSAEEELRKRGFTRATLSIRYSGTCEILQGFYGKLGYEMLREKTDGKGIVLAKNL